MNILIFETYVSYFAKIYEYNNNLFLRCQSWSDFTF